VEQIHDLHIAEEQLVEALPKMAAAAKSDLLREAFERHLAETRGQLQRLDEIIATLAPGRASEPCGAMQGLVAEGEQIISAQGDPAAKDAALIAAAQRIEHYEIAGYGTAGTLAGQLDHDDARELLDDTLDEESNADTRPCELSRSEAPARSSDSARIGLRRVQHRLSRDDRGARRGGRRDMDTILDRVTYGC
jgi:ferritin-like metal-binding protein YciE